MLVLARRVGEEIVIGPNIRLTVVDARNGLVRLGIAAPQSVRVLRQEVVDRQAECEAACVAAQATSDRPKDRKIMEGLIRIAR